MIDAKRLLDQFLGAGQDGGSADAVGGEPGRQSAVGSLPGGVGGALGSIQDYARQNPMLAGALAGGLASVLLGSKGVRRLAGSALGYGGAAVIGGLAYKAYRDYQAGKAASGSPPVQTKSTASVPAVIPPPADSPFAIANAAQGADVFALGLVTAMIAAAKADGHVDADERGRILGKLAENGLSAEEEAFLAKELAAPLDIDRVVASAKTKEQAIEVYAASLVAISPDHPAERAYLDMLAARLGLEPELARSVEQTVAGAVGTSNRRH